MNIKDILTTIKQTILDFIDNELQDILDDIGDICIYI